MPDLPALRWAREGRARMGLRAGHAVSPMSGGDLDDPASDIRAATRATVAANGAGADTAASDTEAAAGGNAADGGGSRATADRDDAASDYPSATTVGVVGVAPYEPALISPAGPLSIRPFARLLPAEPVGPGPTRSEVLVGGTIPSTDVGSPTRPAHRLDVGRWWAAARRAAVDGVRWAAERWRASLQLRVAATTVLLSGLVVFVVGMLSIGTITAGILDGKRQAAQAEVRNGVGIAQRQLAAAPREDSSSISRTRNAVQQAVADRGTAAGVFSIVVISGNAEPFVSGLAKVEDVPQALRREVEKGRFADIYAPVQAPEGGTTKGLVVGAPVTRQPGSVELYYLFPLQAEQRTVGLVRNTVLLTGILLVALLAAVAALVTGQVVRPVRVAAAIAERFASGRLQERMQVRGKDDLAALAAAFNDMADSLQGQINKLEEMSRLQRRFTSDVSHELRTPLTTIRMATDVLHASRSGFEPQVARSAELLQNELDRFEALLTDLLEISRYDAHVAVLEPDPVDLRGLVRSAVSATEGVVRQAGVEVDIDLPDEPVVADVDGRRVERILRNLMVNAVEHGEGGPIEMQLRGDDRAVAVTVRDHGVGLRPGEAALVFDRFWRADPSRDRRTGGTGLGLSISLEDARLHGGWLHAWGRPGQGAQFRLTLPVRSGDVVVSSPLPIEPPDATRPARLAGGVGRSGQLT
jgi:two-component system sensor histidine kinase MtrB